jgi:glycosyltransferase involved in cell wall biosynthesis
MNVCMLTYSFYESDTRVRNYAMTLTEQGHQVDVIGLRRKGESRSEVVDGVKVYRIQTRSAYDRGQLFYAYRIIAFLLRSAVFIAHRHMSRPYHLVHVHSVPDFLVFSALIPKLLGARIILDIHDILPELYASKFHACSSGVLFRLLVLIERWSAAFADHVIVANDIWCERLVSRSVHQGKCATICNYPDPAVFYPHPMKKPNGRFVIIYPGSLNHHQGVDIAIKAFAKVADRMRDAEFHIYGEGPEKASLIALRNKLCLSQRVIFHEVLPSEQVARVMADSDLAVEPKRADSQFATEAVSMKIREFLALGVPIIASRTIAHDYYFSDSMVQFFEPGNEEDLASCILLVRRDDNLRNRLISNGCKHIEKNNWNERKQKYLELINSLATSNR